MIPNCSCVVIGRDREHYLSRDGDLVILATETAHGMPINSGHCRLVSKGRTEEACAYRARYLKLYGDAQIKALP